MGVLSGIQKIGAYTGTVAENLAELLTLIPDPDAAHGTGAVGGGSQGTYNTYLDEMSPGAAAQLRVEILALSGEEAGDSASGSHTITAGEVTATEVVIVTGLANLTLANGSVSIWRAGTNVTADAVITESAPGTIKVQDGAVTYDLTAGDIINWIARP